MNTYYVAGIPYSSELYHHGIKGQHWGIRRYQNEDGSLTSAGEKRYLNGESTNKTKNALDKKPRDYSKLKKAAKIAAITAAAAAAGYGAYKLGKNIQFGHEQIVDQIANKKFVNAATYRNGMMRLNDSTNSTLLKTAMMKNDTKLFNMVNDNWRSQAERIMSNYNTTVDRIESERAALKKGASFVTKIKNASEYARQVKNIRR